MVLKIMKVKLRMKMRENMKNVNAQRNSENDIDKENVQSN